VSMYEEQVNCLLKSYRELHKKNAPDWAVCKRTAPEEKVVPTIPFVGKHYAKQQKKILVYASAENLTNHCVGRPTNRPWLDDDAHAENRHRRCFDDQQMQDNPVIPYVHCGPMETGLLLTAVMHIASRIGFADMDQLSPREFCECICFGNYGKYSEETPNQRSCRMGLDSKVSGKNIDYAGDAAMMEHSNAFVEADIKTLTPDYIVLPATMYAAEKTFIDQIKGDAAVIPIYQMLAGNVNNYIAPNKRRQKYEAYQLEKLSPSVQLAYSGITTVSQERYRYVFTYLDVVLKQRGLLKKSAE